MSLPFFLGGGGEIAAEGQVRRLKREIRELYEELSLHDLFSRPDAGAVAYKPFQKGQREALRAQISQFFEEFNGADDEETAMENIHRIELTSYRHAREVLLQCNILYNRCKMMIKEQPSSHYSSSICNKPWRGEEASEGRGGGPLVDCTNEFPSSMETLSSSSGWGQLSLL